MRLDKIKNTFNDYKLEISFGQLEALRKALEADHTDPVSDEMLAELQWYMDRVPGPGEEEDEVKKREEQGQVVPTEGGEEGDFPVPMPPTEGGAELGGAPQPPPEEMPGSEGGAPGAEAEMPPPSGEEGGVQEPPMPTEGGPAPEGADEHLPEPPAE